MKTLGEFPARVAVFRRSEREGDVVVVGVDLPGYELRPRYGEFALSAIGVNLDDTVWSRFFLVYVADCFDPPLAVVRADNASDALDAFIDELDWAHVSEPDLADYGEEALSYGPRGQPYDPEAVQVFEVFLLRTEA